MTKRPTRIAPSQAPMTRSMQALMICDTELKALVYRGPFQLAETAQRDALLYILNTEFNTTIDLPEVPPLRRVKKRDMPGTLIAHLVVIDKKPVIFYEENDVVSAMFGFILGRYGIDIARQVTFRDGMLPPAEEPAP